MKEIFAGYKPPPKHANDTEEEAVYKKPVKVTNNEVTRDGAFSIGFNQKMKVPDFIDNG